MIEMQQGEDNGAVQPESEGDKPMEGVKEADKSIGPKDEAHRRGPPDGGPTPERAANSQRALPDGAKVEPMLKDGNCLFASLAQGLNDLSPDVPHKLTAAEVRAKIAVHLRKRQSQDLGQVRGGH